MATKTFSRVIALEEAFLHPKLWDLFPADYQRQLAPVKESLLEVGSKRIRNMDAAGIDLQVLSHVQPGVQMLNDLKQSIDLCREVNDWLADVIRANPTRFAGFAMLPTQSPADAADELERTVKTLGFKGALINGHTNGRYLDDESFSILFDRAEALDVPIYIHPTDPPQTIIDTYYRDYSVPLVTGWGWPVETGTHLLRLMCAGVFDLHPRLKIIVGHMGELIPYCLSRINIALTAGSWLLAGMEKKDKGTVSTVTMQKNVLYYMRENVFVTSSGVFDQPVFDCALSMLGIKNLLFSVDYPLRDNFEAMEFLRGTKLSREDKERFSHENTEQLLKLDGSLHTSRTSGQGLASSFHAFSAKSKSKIGRALISILIK
jgi:predicted TIM-barrel fold metal-dependent hydrolase